MGLDITAYATATFLRPTSEDDDPDYENGEVRLYTIHPFERHADGLTEGVYRVGPEKVAFRAGSYSGYNRWRALLAELIGTTPEDIWEANPEEGPFLELIHNSDCKGVIGPTTCAKLAKDFAEWNDRAMDFEPKGRDADDLREYFRRGYKNWARAFAIAAGNGAVHLH